MELIEMDFSRDLWSNRTPKEALKDLLSLKRLRFGDARQIEAVLILRLADDLIGSEHQCRECKGTGEIESDEGYCNCCGRECDHCDGGTATCKKCGGEGVMAWTHDEVYGMLPTRICDLLAQRAWLEAA